MPPKKKGKKSGGKKGKKSGTKTPSREHAGKSEQLNELSKEFYLIQIRDLENRLARYQKRCDELELMSGETKHQNDQISKDKKEIVTFLKKTLAQRGDEIADINERLVGLQQARETEKENYEGSMNQLRTEFQETKDHLTSENMILGGKLAALEEFKVQKEELMNNFKLMEEKLKQQEEDHQEVLYNLERKQVVDKDRLKKEMVSRVNQVAGEFRKVSNKQMAETTKRTIRENVSINAQLGKMSDKTMELIQENDELRAKEKQQKQHIDMLETNEKELAKKNHSNQKIIRMLTDKCKNQETLITEMEMRESEYQELEQENDLLQQQVEATRNEAMQLSRENELQEGDLESLQSKLNVEQKHKRKLEKVLYDCTKSIQAALSVTTTEDVEETPLQHMEKRDAMLENLLILLNSAASIGLGPTPSELAAGHQQVQRKDSSKMPGSGKGIQKGEMPQSPFSRSLSNSPVGMKSTSSVTHYQLGDLGLIPRPKKHIPTSLEKAKDLSNMSRLGGLRKVVTKSVGVQTISTPKAMFYADQLMSQIPNSQLLHDLTNSEKPVLPHVQSQNTKKTSHVY